MKVLFAPTEDYIKRERTKLTAGVSAGNSISIPVDSSTGYAVNDYIVIGAEGGETAEVTQITSVPDATHIVATLALAHLTDDPIVKYRYNKRKFYGSVTSGGAYTELTSYGSPAVILVNNPAGALLEYTGGEGYLYFKSTYWNTTTSEESDILAANPVLADESARYTSLYAIRKQAGITENPFYDDGRVEEKRKQAENEVNSYLYEKYSLPLTNDLGVAEVPPMVATVTRLLAAGYIDYEEFQGDGQGVKWLGEARGILNAIQKGSQRLIGADGMELSVKTRTQGISGYPDRVDNNNGPSRMFTTRQRF